MSTSRAPRLSEAAVLRWARAHARRTGRRPTQKSGPVAGAPGLSWAAINQALARGRRGLPGGDSLARLLTRALGPSRAPLCPCRIRDWAVAQHARTGRYPTLASGPIAEAPGETWGALDAALRHGRRGLPGGGSLSALLRPLREQAQPPELDVAAVLAWADRHFKRAGRWPHARSGLVPEAAPLTWWRVDRALRQGRASGAGPLTLAELLAARRGRPRRPARGPLTQEQVLAWARRHFRRTGAWPTQKSGAVADAPGETWKAVDTALAKGYRGLPPGGSLSRLLRPPAASASSTRPA